MKWFDKITNSMDMNLNKLQEIMEYRRKWSTEEPDVLKFMGPKV